MDFHPQVQSWLSDKFTQPTDIQTKAWPEISLGRHVLVSAPTGSGKTLTAFLWAIDGLITGRLPKGQTGVLYVSPLKALNNDIQRNLRQPLGELGELFLQNGEDFPNIRVMTRSGDTPQSERQRMLRNPPEILVTTPESLALLLTTVNGRQSLATVSCVILDEIHAVVDSRRGVGLMVCLERIVELAGEFQRIALSATVEPLDTVARFIGGSDQSGIPRDVETISSPHTKQIDLSIAFPKEAKARINEGQPVWDVLLRSMKGRIDSNKSSLVFVNARRLAEKVTLGLNNLYEESKAYAHHGSLAKDIRLEVESRFKKGELQAIVATSSLELGIDIGNLDEVVLIQSPPSIASAMQRIGRAGHRVNQVSRATLYPLHARDFLDACVLSEAINERNLEPLNPIEAPLDMLAQIVVSMVATEDWHFESLFELICRAYPYRDLSRDQFESVLEMLDGKYQETRIRDLKPRIAFDRLNRMVSIREGAVFAFYTSGGSIPDRGYYQLRAEPSGDRIGELDEEFVWEAKIGQRFTFGSQQWRIQRITHNDVFVTPSPSGADIPPFWRSETVNSSFHFANLEGDLLQDANESIQADGGQRLKLRLENSGFNDVAADELVDYLVRQRSATNCDLPHSGHIVAEFVKSGPAGYRTGGNDGQLVIHTCWGGRVNRPIGYALESIWREHFQGEPDLFIDNHVIVIQMKHGASAAEVFEKLKAADLRVELRKCLETTGFFGGRFRECAGRSLLITKRSFTHRMPLWMTRMQAKKLMTATSKYTDFPIVLETWRTCLNDEFDMQAVEQVMSRLSSGEIRVSFVELNVPSPFASNVVFEQVSRYMYADDTPESRNSSGLSDSLIDDVIGSAESRPVLKRDAIEAIEGKIQRTSSGYIPENEVELTLWLKERIWIRAREWFEQYDIVEQASRFQFASNEWLSHPESLDLAARDIETAFTNAIQFYGPRTREELHSLFPLSHEQIDQLVDDLLESEVLIDEVRVESHDETYICDRWNFEAILRFQRSTARKGVVTQSVCRLPWFLANLHGFGNDYDESNVLDAMERLRGFVAPVSVWLNDIWRPRVGFVERTKVFGVLGEHDVCWRGEGRNRIGVGLIDDFTSTEKIDAESAEVLKVFRDATASYSFLQLLDGTGDTARAFSRKLWNAVWDGRITNDSVAALEVGVERKYELPLSRPFPSRPRGSIPRARNSANWPGLWRRIDSSDQNPDPLSELENLKDQCRILLMRYGVLSRELVNREGGQFNWGRMFRALRMMELSGEVVAGLFFEQLSGPQFMLAELMSAVDPEKLERQTFWVSSMDPVSPSGLGLDWIGLPSRRVTTHLGFCDDELLIVSESKGKKIAILGELNHPAMPELLGAMQKVITQGKRLEIETINGESAVSSPLLDPISEHLALKRSHANVFVDSIDL